MPSKNSAKIIAAVIIGLIIIAGGWLLLRSQNKPAVNLNMNNDNVNIDNGNENINTNNGNTNANNENGKSGVVVFDLTAKPFEFSQKEIRLKKGDRVRINLAVTEGFHDWAVDEFNAKTRQMSAGESDSVEFTADKEGIFEYYCSVNNHRELGMVGRLIVE